jgi:ferredoxin
MAVRVVVDWELCESNALCVEACPEVFRVDDDDNLQILNETPPASLLDRLREAERVCPRQAIQIVED